MLYSIIENKSFPNVYMWLGTKVCVQWGAKLGIFESESVNIAFLSTVLIYISFFRLRIEF